MSAPAAAGSRWRLIATTALLTSLVWIAGLALWLSAARPGPMGPVPSVGEAPGPVRPEVRAARAGPSGALVIPVVGVAAGQLSDTFTQARANGARVHDAIDIMAPRGAAVVAAAAGRVEKLFLSNDGGNTIYVRSLDGRLIYYYAHLDGYAPGLAEGRQVEPGTPLGTVGSSGNADPAAPHLHFAIAEADPAGPWYQHAPALNPYPWLVSGQRPELGARTQRSAPSLPSADSLRRNERPERTYATPREGPEVNTTRSPVIR